MSTRITKKMLESAASQLNKLTDSPETAWTEGADGKFTANNGNYHISGAYGGWCLHRICSDGGGVDDVFSCGHVPARNLHERMKAFIEGYHASNL